MTDGIVSAALQGDGKIVAAGYSGNNPDFALARYNADGSLDTTFDSDGTVQTPVGTSSDRATSVMVQPDGKIVAAGWSTVPNTGDFSMVRYNTDGSLDTTFDGDGIVRTDVGDASVPGRAAVVQTDGKIVTFTGIGLASSGLTRYNPDGTLDTSFGNRGKVLSTLSAGVIGTNPAALILQPDQKIVLVAISGIEFTQRIGIARYNPDGTLDTSFDGDGIVTTNLPGSTFSYPFGAAMGPDGKIVVTSEGVAFSTGARQHAIVLYNTDGSLDTSFDGDGVLISTTTTWLEAAIQADGKILTSIFGSAFLLARYNVNGSIDTRFDGDGMVTTPMLPGGASIRSIVPMTDGRILVGGHTSFGLNDFGLVRYQADGSLDLSFNGTGKVITPVSGDDFLTRTAIQSDGKIIAAGYALTGTIGDLALVRYNPDGSLDGTYGLGGKAVIDLGANDRVGGLALDASDNAIITGSGYRFFIARITSDFAPLVDLGGRVTSTNGQGIGNAQVVLRGQNNNRQNALTNAFGYYIFQGVSSNETYTVSVSAKRYRIQPPTRTITLMNSVADLDFVGTSGSESKGVVVGGEKVTGPGQRVVVRDQRNP